jgi:hypothetical protein
MDKFLDRRRENTRFCTDSLQEVPGLSSAVNLLVNAISVYYCRPKYLLSLNVSNNFWPTVFSGHKPRTSTFNYVSILLPWKSNDTRVDQTSRLCG